MSLRAAIRYSFRYNDVIISLSHAMLLWTLYTVFGARCANISPNSVFPTRGCPRVSSPSNSEHNHHIHMMYRREYLALPAARRLLRSSQAPM